MSAFAYNELAKIVRNLNSDSKTRACTGFDGGPEIEEAIRSGTLR